MTNADILPNAVPAHLAVGLLPWESDEEFAELYAGYVDHYLPKGPTEIGLVEQLVWLDWRRRRLRLGERALHMASLKSRASAGHNDQLTSRAVQHLEHTRSERSSAVAIRASDDADTRSTSEWMDMLAAAETALELVHQAVMEDQGERAFKKALAALPEETQDWFTETADDENSSYTFDTDGLQRFLLLEVVPFFRNSLAGYQIGPLVRLQAWGESLDPDRMDKLLALDERLGRQFEKTLGMLLKMNELRQTNFADK